MTYAEAEQYLYALPRFAAAGEAAYAPGLSRIEAVLAAMGNPHEAYPIVHVAGTNGKGSTASFLAAIATASGRKAGLHTSPHLSYVGERMRINGEPVERTWIADTVGQYRTVFDEVGVSFFEAAVALSLLYFADQQVDLAIVEVGLGGRLDATNIVSPVAAIITSIGLDHTHILGNSIRDITREKAGIIKRGVPVIAGVEQDEAKEVIGQIAAEKEAKVIDLDDVVAWHAVMESSGDMALEVSTSHRTYDKLTIGLPGQHQVRNALLALLAAENVFGDDLRLEHSVTSGLSGVKTLAGLRGRMEIVRKEPLVILDVGHNTEGLKAALTTVSSLRRDLEGQLFLLFGTMRDKDIAEMAKLISDTEARVFTAPLFSDHAPEDNKKYQRVSKRTESSRAMPPEETAQMLRSLAIKATSVSSFEDGLSRFYEESTAKDILLVVGSHYLVSQFYKLVDS